MVTTLRLIELMSARMFHDLAGPIGAVSNGLEFFDEEDEVIKEKALHLVKSSTHEAVLRLKFFRQAYGSLSDDEVYLSGIEMLISEFLQDNKVQYVWNIEDNLVNSYLAKVILNFVIIALNAMIQGGTLSFEQQNGMIIIKLQGANIIFTEETKLLLEGNTKYTSLTSANIQLYYTYLMMKEANAKLSINQSTNDLQFIVTY